MEKNKENNFEKLISKDIEKEKEKRIKYKKDLEIYITYNCNELKNINYFKIFYKFIKNEIFIGNIFYKNKERIEFLRKFPLYRSFILQPILFHIIYSNINKIYGYFYYHCDLKTYIIETSIKEIDKECKVFMLVPEKTLLRKLKKKNIISNYLSSEEILKLKILNNF